MYSQGAGRESGKKPDRKYKDKGRFWSNQILVREQALDELWSCGRWDVGMGGAQDLPCNWIVENHSEGLIAVVKEICHRL